MWYIYNLLQGTLTLVTLRKMATTAGYPLPTQTNRKRWFMRSLYDLYIPVMWFGDVMWLSQVLLLWWQHSCHGNQAFRLSGVELFVQLHVNSRSFSAVPECLICWIFITLQCWMFLYLPVACMSYTSHCAIRLQSLATAHYHSNWEQW